MPVIRSNARIDTAVRRFTINSLICCLRNLSPFPLVTNEDTSHPMYLTGETVQFTYIRREIPHLPRMRIAFCAIYNLFFFFFLRAKVYWTVKTAVIDEQCDGKFVFWVCACIKGCSRFFFLSIKLWLFLSELSSRTNECFRIIIFSDGLKINLDILLKWNWKENSYVDFYLRGDKDYKNLMKNVSINE